MGGHDGSTAWTTGEPCQCQPQHTPLPLPPLHVSFKSSETTVCTRRNRHVSRSFVSPAFFILIRKYRFQKATKTKTRKTHPQRRKQQGGLHTFLNLHHHHHHHHDSQWGAGPSPLLETCIAIKYGASAVYWIPCVPNYSDLTVIPSDETAGGRAATSPSVNSRLLKYLYKDIPPKLKSGKSTNPRSHLRHTGHSPLHSLHGIQPFVSFPPPPCYLFVLLL